MCVTVERYYAVCRPSRFRVIHTRHYAKRLIVGAFVLSAVVWLPMCFIKTPRKLAECLCDQISLPEDAGSAHRALWVACVEIPRNRPMRWYRVYSWVRQTITTFIPIAFLVILNSLTLRGFVRLKRKRGEWNRRSAGPAATGDAESGGTTTQGLIINQGVADSSWYQKDHNIIHLLTGVVVSFSLTMIPVGVCNAFYTGSRSNDYDYQLFRAISNDLEMLHHALNFYMYILYSKPVRLAFKDLFCFC
ncbi:probable G-protein coupled receptor B0563.6 [Macrobrachium nipponense]|uniref:probable G-protein coupled receptor B0563.6 n=1 Tax=Macrobrachium nipponense TaxID=159736 RepID=UPI0030C80026